VTTTPPADPAAIDPFEDVQSELAQNTVPTPEDVLSDVGPLAALWYARETAYYAVKLFTASLSIDSDEPPPDDSEPVRALAALSAAAGNLDGACVLVSLLPPGYGDDAPAN
jgi:hypothetical protein